MSSKTAILKATTAIALVVSSFSSASVSVFAEEQTGYPLDGVDLTTYENNGYKFEKVSHAKSGTETKDGIVDYTGTMQIRENTDGLSDYADSVQSYTYCATSYGDWVYMGTMYGALSAYTQVERAAISMGASKEVASAVVDAMFNGKLNKGKEDDGIPVGSVFFKFNVKTGETKILMSRTLYNQGKCDGVPIFRSATKFNNKLYFVGLVSDGKALAGQTLYGQQIPDNPNIAINYEISYQSGVPCVYELDPETDKLVKVAQCVSQDGYMRLNNSFVFTSTRAIDTFTATKADGTKEEWLLAGGLSDGSNEEYGVTILASKNPTPVNVSSVSNESDINVLHGDFKTIATQSDLQDYPAIKRSDSQGGGGLYQIIQYGENTVYTSIVSGKNDANDPTSKERAYAIVKGVYNPEAGEVNDSDAWTWTPVVGDVAQGARYTFGIDPERTAAGACTLDVHNGYLYIGEYNDVNYSLTDILTNKSFRILAKNLTQSINLYRMNENEEVEMVVGDPTVMFPEGGISGKGSGYESHMNQYTWMTDVIDGKLWLSTMDETSLTHCIAQMVNGELLNMSKDEWKSQLNYLMTLLRLMVEENKHPSATPYSSFENQNENNNEPISTRDRVLQAIENINDELKDSSTSTFGVVNHSDETLPAVELTDEQITDLVNAIDSGEIELNNIDEETYYSLFALNLEMKQLENMFESSLSVDFADLYDEALEFLGSIVANSNIPDNVKKMLNTLLTFTTSENLGNLRTCLNYMKDSEAGFDLYVIDQDEEGNVSVDTVTTNGFDDRYNHGLRVFTTVPGYMVIGTANPFYGAQIWRLANENIKEEETVIDPEPENPETPIEPEEPEAPSNPEVKPEEPVQNEDRKPVVDTSDKTNVLGASALLFGSLTAVVAIIFTKRKYKNGL